VSADDSTPTDTGEAVDTVDIVAVRRAIERCNDSQRRLTDHLLGLPDTDPTQPCALPDWTLGHLLTHIARNADSTLRMLSGLAQYWKGPESRNADIQLGARRQWGELVEDVRTTGEAVSKRLDEVDDWSGLITTTTAPRPKVMVPDLRRREIEIHRVDLGLGYGFADLPSDFVRAETRWLEMMWQARQPMGMTPLPAAVRERPEYERLAWLFGRISIDGVDPANVY
jgi:maleylpyruvate isomerase